MENQQTANTDSKSPSILPIIIVIIITAIIIGGGVYLWQNAMVKKAKDDLESKKTTLQQQINSLQNKITELLTTATSETENLSDNPKMYFKDTTVSLTFPNNYELPATIVDGGLSVPQTFLSISLYGKADEVLGHPVSMDLTNYCDDFNVDNDSGSVRCFEGALNGKPMVTLYISTKDIGGSDTYYLFKTVLIETGIEDYPVISFQVQLPEYNQPYSPNINIDDIASGIDLYYTTQDAFEDLDFIINNIDFNSPIANSTLPEGIIMSNDCTSQGGTFFADTDCGEMTSLGKRYGAEEWICCK